jgi:hypothetical protein
MRTQLMKSYFECPECPFLDSDPKYAYGAEFGFLYCMLLFAERDDCSDLDAPTIGHTVALANKDQILLLVEKMGWDVVKMEEIELYWLHLELKQRPN